MNIIGNNKRGESRSQGRNQSCVSPPCLWLRPHTHQPAVRQLRQPRDPLSSYPCPALFAYLWTSFAYCAQATLCSLPQATNLRSISNRLCSVLTVRILLASRCRKRVWQSAAKGRLTGSALSPLLYSASAKPTSEGFNVMLEPSSAIAT